MLINIEVVTDAETRRHRLVGLDPDSGVLLFGGPVRRSVKLAWAAGAAALAEWLAEAAGAADAARAVILLDHAAKRPPRRGRRV